jgi:hypothetical protein
MICAMTGQPHRLFWMRSAWWCSDCRQKIESCCEGGGCPSVSDVLAPGESDSGTTQRSTAVPSLRVR